MSRTRSLSAQIRSDSPAGCYEEYLEASSRARIVRLLLAEAAVHATIGAVAGLVCVGCQLLTGSAGAAGWTPPCSARLGDQPAPEIVPDSSLTLLPFGSTCLWLPAASPLGDPGPGLRRPMLMSRHSIAGCAVEYLVSLPSLHLRGQRKVNPHPGDFRKSSPQLLEHGTRRGCGSIGTGGD